MNLTGNEILRISTEFLDEMTANYIKQVVGMPNALKSVIFNSIQINRSMTWDAVGIGFVRVPNSPRTSILTQYQESESLLIAVSIGINGTIITSNDGIMPISTCPHHCSIPPQANDVVTISSDDIAAGRNALLDDNPIKLRGLYFSRKVIMEILSQDKCQGITVFVVEYPNSFTGLAICGKDVNNDPQVGNGQLIAYSNINI